MAEQDLNSPQVACLLVDRSCFGPPERMCPVIFAAKPNADYPFVGEPFFAETEQVAFLPTNVPPGIDFSDDPLLQGRLFSYLNTQKARLGTTNFHQIPVSAPRCPFRNFQRDRMIQAQVPNGRANYEPNSLSDDGEGGGPRESEQGFRTVAINDERNGASEKLRVRSETFADHYSQARLSFRSQTAIEQAHIASAFTFELSKVTLEPVRLRMLGNLRNADEASPDAPLRDSRWNIRGECARVPCQYCITAGICETAGAARHSLEQLVRLSGRHAKTSYVDSPVRTNRTHLESSPHGR